MSESLERLNETIENTKKKIAERDRERREEEGRQRLEEEKFWEEEREHLDEKKEIAKKIFEWGEEFSKSEQFRELLELEGLTKAFVRLSYAKSDSLIVYETGGWGHERGPSSHRRSFLSLRRDGTFDYVPERTHIGGGGPVSSENFSRPAGLAERLTRDYLEDLQEHIQSGKVYEDLREKLEKAEI